VFILAGYFIRVLNRTAGGDEVPPVFDEWGELAVTGLQAVLIGVAYALVPTILGGGVVAIGIGLSGDGSLDGLGVAAVLVGGLLWTPFVRCCLPASGSTGQLRSNAVARCWLRVRDAETDLALSILRRCLGNDALGGVARRDRGGVLNVVPILGQIAGVFVGFYAAVAAYSVIGRAWEDLPVVDHTGPDAMLSTSVDTDR